MSVSLAVVLHVYDVGEADRLCILLTEKHGKIMARAYGVRQCKSRMGGVILPLYKIAVSLHASSQGWCIREAHLVEACHHRQPLVLQQGAEMLMLLLEDEEPVPDIFGLADDFLYSYPRTIVPFTIKLLHVMGVLPVDNNDERFRALSLRARDFVFSCTRQESLQSVEKRLPHGDSSLVSFCESILNAQLPRPLRSRIVACAIGL